MAVNFIDAVNAYQKMAGKDSLPGLESRNDGNNGDFADILRGATQDAIGTLRAGRRPHIGLKILICHYEERTTSSSVRWRL